MEKPAVLAPTGTLERNYFIRGLFNVVPLDKFYRTAYTTVYHCTFQNQGSQAYEI